MPLIPNLETFHVVLDVTVGRYSSETSTRSAAMYETLVKTKSLRLHLGAELTFESRCNTLEVLEANALKLYNAGNEGHERG